VAGGAPVNAASSLLYGMAHVLHPRMLWLMLWPMLVSLGIWGLLALFLWMRLAVRLADWLKQGLDTVGVLAAFNVTDVTMIAAHVLLILFFVPLVYLTALFILGLAGVQKMVDHVASRSFPGLERRRGGGTVGSVLNAVIVLFGLLVLGMISLPFWLIPPLWPVITVAILGWVNQRLLRYDALAEHADVAEMERVFRERRGTLYLMGVLFALTAYIPIVGFFAPVVFGLAFIHYLLGALASLRPPIAPI
jgi:CysZ protein